MCSPWMSKLNNSHSFRQWVCSWQNLITGFIIVLAFFLPSPIIPRQEEARTLRAGRFSGPETTWLGKVVWELRERRIQVGIRITWVILPLPSALSVAFSKPVRLESFSIFVRQVWTGDWPHHLPLQGLNHEPLQLLTFNTPWKALRVEIRREALCALGKLAEWVFR